MLNSENLSWMFYNKHDEIHPFGAALLTLCAVVIIWNAVMIFHFTSKLMTHYFGAWTAEMFGWLLGIGILVFFTIVVPALYVKG